MDSVYLRQKKCYNTGLKRRIVFLINAKPNESGQHLLTSFDFRLGDEADF